jgi:superfamily II DNA/RNA helicase
VNPVNPLNLFAALGLSPRLVRAADELGYEIPTPIQSAAIPAVLAGRDLLGSAATGSGKTAAYVFPVLQRMDLRVRPALRRAHVLVLVPTRELAAQVGETMIQVGRFLNDPVKVSVLYGGVSINPQMMALRGGADIVVATPGRLLDIVAQNALKLSEVDCLVLDEADRLLDAGFADEVSQVLALLPRRRQNLLFSATFPEAVKAFTEQLLSDPVRVEVSGEPATEGQIEEHAVEVDAARRTPLLRHMIEKGEWSRVLVFVATRYACDHVADKLRRNGLEAAAFHGDASQGARTRTLADFKAGRIRVLIATDLGARGIDIALLPVVVNYDLPRAAEDYTHRIGRTARAGANGLAVSFISAATESHFRLIEKRQGRRVERERIAGFEPTEIASPEAATGGVKGKRPSKKDKLRAAAALADTSTRR